MKNIYTFNRLILLLLLSSFTFNIFGQCANLTSYQPAGWDNKIVISAVTGTNTSESHFYENQTLYVDFSVVNNGTCATSRTFTAYLFLDGVFKNTFTFSALANGFQTSQSDYLIAGTLSVGNHSIQIDIDSPNVIAETNESDNTVYRSFTVEQGSCISTPVTSIFNGSRTFNTEHYLNTNFRVKDQCNTATIRIQDWNSTNSTSNSIEIISPTNLWSTNNQRFAGSVMWAAKSAYNYYSGVHSRASYNNSNGALEGTINSVFSGTSGDYTDNASMSATGGIMKVGLGSSGTLANSWGPLDIIAHEYTHAVTGSSAALAYINESGALNESFSDIFGETIENYTLGSNDWLLGANRTSGAIRSMSNPKLYSHPNTYLGTYWRTDPTYDNGGVHFNSGVQNYWYYLLSQGGSGINDNSYSYSITGLGIAKARLIAYRTLAIILYNKPNTTYNDAKNGSIQAAEDIYGIGSTEANTVKNAWCAVGVGTCSCPLPLAVNGTGGGTFCNSTTISANGGSGGTIYFQGTTSGGTSFANASTTQSVNSSGTYYFRAYNTCGWGPEGSVTVTINTVPSAVSVSGGGTFCYSAFISASGGSGGTIYWQGTTSGGTSFATAATTQPVSASGIYYFRAYNSCGWGPQGSVTVIIGAVPSAVSVSGGGTFCSSTIITASGGSGGTIYWQGMASGGTSFATPSTSQSVGASGTYYFRSYNSCGWGAEGSVTVTISTLPTAVSASSSASPCYSAFLTATGGIGGNIYWQGTASGGTSFATPATSQSVSQSGTYYFRAYNSCGWGTEGSVTVTINTTATVIIYGGGTFCNSANLTAFSNNGGTVYWQNTTSGGTSTTTPITSQITVSSSGTYYFRVYNSCGWGPEGSVTVAIIPSALPLSGIATSGIQVAAQTINSTQSIPSGTNVIYQAGNSIFLQGTFDAQSGSIFKAEIKGCAN